MISNAKEARRFVAGLTNEERSLLKRELDNEWLCECGWRNRGASHCEHCRGAGAVHAVPSDKHRVKAATTESERRRRSRYHEKLRRAFEVKWPELIEMTLE